jgi:hypothetical protein
MTTMTTMNLCGTGWVPWSDFTAVADGWNATWVDLSGAQLALLPREAPLATHVWAWRDGVWARARVDDGEVVVGFLHDAGHCPRGAADCSEVPVGQVLTAQTWSEPHICGRLGGAPLGGRGDPRRHRCHIRPSRG